MIGTLAGGMTKATALAAADKCADFFEYYAGLDRQAQRRRRADVPGHALDYTNA